MREGGEFLEGSAGGRAERGEGEEREGELGAGLVLLVDLLS